jgi:hypothetical protein
MMDFEAEAKDVTADTTITEIETGRCQHQAERAGNEMRRGLV